MLRPAHLKKFKRDVRRKSPIFSQNAELCENRLTVDSLNLYCQYRPEATLFLDFPTDKSGFLVQAELTEIILSSHLIF